MHAKNCFIHSYKLKLSSQKRSAFSSYTYIFKEGQDDGRPPNFPIFLGGKFLLIFYGGVYHERKIQTLLRLIWNKNLFNHREFKNFFQMFFRSSPKMHQEDYVFYGSYFICPFPFLKKINCIEFFYFEKV